MRIVAVIPHRRTSRERVRVRGDGSSGIAYADCPHPDPLPHEDGRGSAEPS